MKVYGSLVCLLVSVSYCGAQEFFTNVTGDRTAFEMAADAANLSLVVDGFEDLDPGLNDYGQSLTRDGYEITADSGGGNALRSTSDAENVIDGDISMILFNGSDPLTFNFDNPINAFAIQFGDLDLFFGGGFEFSIDGNQFELLDPQPGDTDSAYFFGVIDLDNSFSSISFNRTAGDGYFFDNVTSAVVPEPSAAIIVMASGMIMAVRRRRS